MEVILREDVQDLGITGDVVAVSRGFARNYLIPRHLAVEATKRNLKQLEHDKRVIMKHAEAKRKLAAALHDRLKGLSITVTKPVGENDRLYGSVTAKDIVEGLAEEDIQGVTRKQVQLDDQMRTLGIYEVPIRLDAEHTVNINVWVVAKD
jgi:large subunit ribosomal protein L9